MPTVTNDTTGKMGRRQLMELFEQKFRDSVSAGDIITIATCDLSEMPSALASRKLEEMLRTRNMSQLGLDDNGRATHARAAVRD